MKKYRIEEMSLLGTPLYQLEGCSSLYCEVWKEEPWNEDFWTTEIVMQDLRDELALPQSKGFLALANGTEQNNAVIGFTWGYGVNKEDMRRISGATELDRFFKDNPVFYIDELGVDSKCRFKGVGRELSKSLMQWAIETGHKTILLRTDLRAEAARFLYKRLGFIELNTIDAIEHQRSYWVLEF